MKSFKQYINEKLMTFGKQAYPKFGNVVILAGGAGSGKGFQLQNLLGIEGKSLDVDALKALALKSNKFAQKVKEETGYDIKTFDLRNPENVSKIHEIISDVYGVVDKTNTTLFHSILASTNDRKPNIIFDVTLKSMGKLESIARNIQDLGYSKENIHIVWIVNDINIARQQNQKRDRIVPDEILLDTHEGAALTMKKILDMGDSLKKYMDGDIYISFNKAGVDVGIEKSNSGGHYISKANYFKVKEKGKPQQASEKISKDLYDKIVSYTPNTNKW